MYLWHLVKFHGHSDDIQTYDGCNCKVEILAGYDVVNEESGLRVLTVVWGLSHLCQWGRELVYIQSPQLLGP